MSHGCLVEEAAPTVVTATPQICRRRQENQGVLRASSPPRGAGAAAMAHGCLVEEAGSIPRVWERELGRLVGKWRRAERSRVGKRRDGRGLAGAARGGVNGRAWAREWQRAEV
jgi:hypothetical protein